MTVLIIEDEINACEHLRRLLQKIRPDYILIEHLDSVEDSLNWLENNPHPDLILLDIQLSDGISFELFNHIKIDSSIIFTTAYDQFALQAFKVNSIDYLLKPINELELESAIQKLEQLHIAKTIAPDLTELIKHLSTGKKNRCLVKKGNHYEFISIKDISFIHSDDSLTFLFTKDGQRHIYTKTLQTIMQELDTTQFFQINRKQVVNINNVEKIHPFLNQRLKIQLDTKTDIEFIVSRGKLSEFKNWVDS